MKVTYANAIGDALKEEMRRDGKVLIYGEDIAQFGNIFGITRGMLEEFGPKRVRNTPITETAIIGSAIGAAETGLRPCVELMYSDFTMVAFSEIFHCVSKWRYMHGPEYKLPLVIRSASGSSNGAGSEHSNTVESLFMHAPGLTIITPSCAYDAKGLLKSAIRDDDPVIFLEHKLLYAPGKAANAGGVATSGLEMTQNSMRITWSPEEVDAKLRSIMQNIHSVCVQYGTQADGYINYVNGANIGGFMKVANAMLAQGCV